MLSQAAECSHGPTASGSATQAEEVEKRNAPGGSNTTPELANDATGALTMNVCALYIDMLCIILHANHLGNTAEHCCQTHHTQV